jgi:hypothetical protein
VSVLVGVALGVVMWFAGGLIAPPPVSCPTCVTFGSGVAHPACYVEVVAQGRTCS